MSELGKPYLKKIDKNQKKNRKSMSEMPYVNKKHWRENEIWFKQKTRPRMNYEWIGKTT